MEAPLDKPLETTLKSSSDPAEFSGILSVLVTTALTIFWSCATLGLLQESLFPPMHELLVSRCFRGYIVFFPSGVSISRI